MSSITNLDARSLSAIANCDLNTHLIVYNFNEQRFSTISKKEVNWIQIFLYYFKAGRLKDIQFKLVPIAHRLSQFNWNEAAPLNAHSVQHQAYLKVSALANKALSKNYRALFHKVSARIIEKMIQIDKYKGSRLKKTETSSIQIHWNPCLQLTHLQTLIKKQFHGALSIEGNFRNSNTLLTEAMLLGAKIHVSKQS